MWSSPSVSILTVMLPEKPHSSASENSVSSRSAAGAGCTGRGGEARAVPTRPVLLDLQVARARGQEGKPAAKHISSLGPFCCLLMAKPTASGRGGISPHGAAARVWTAPRPRGGNTDTRDSSSSW